MPYSTMSYAAAIALGHAVRYLSGLSLAEVAEHNAALAPRHPELAAGKGTIKLRPAGAVGIPDAEFQDLIRAALRA